jgi:hypothetical protein
MCLISFLICKDWMYLSRQNILLHKRAIKSIIWQEEINFEWIAIWLLTLQENKVKRHKLNSSTMIITYLVLKITLGQTCIKIHTLDNIVMILSSCWLSSFQCISIHLQLDQASFATQTLLDPSRLVNKCLVPKYHEYYHKVN